MLNFTLLFAVGALAVSSPKSVRDAAWRSVSSSMIAGASLVSAAAAASASTSTTTSSFSTIEEAAKFIEQKCGRTLAANRNSGRFFYRGESALPKRQASLVVSAGDLLSPETYNETGSAEGVAAADYFKSLDQTVLEGVGLFSTGHICTSSQKAASLWGPLYTIFPLDEKLNFLFYRKEPELWQGAWSTPQGAPRGASAFFWRDKEYLRAFLKGNAVINNGLEGALSSEHELVFSSNGGYVAIPIAFENKVATMLGVEPFSPSVIPGVASQMEVDDVRRSSRDRFIVY